MSKTVSTDIFIKIKALRECLDTHTNLTDETKKYLIYLAQNIFKTKTLDFDKYYLFLLYTNKNTNTGRFCLTYNEFLDDKILQKDEKILTNLITEFKEHFFFEFYDNKLLTESDKSSIKQMVDMEYVVLKNTIELCIKNEEISGSIFKDVYPNIFNNFLMQPHESNFVYTGIPEFIYLKLPFEKINKLYIFNMMELLLIISVENKNPQTNEAFDEKTFNNLNIKYDKVIKMIKRYYKGKTKS